MATEAPTMRRTPLFDKHTELGAKIVPFAGYEMPIQYEGIVAEHRAVRNNAGLFDLSHMGEFFFKGRGAGATLDRLVSSDIAGLAVGQARYGLLTNERGTIVDDVIVYRITDGEYMMVVNAANIAKDRAHVLAHLGDDALARAIDTALGDARSRYGIPDSPLHDLVDGGLQDTEQDRYADFAELDGYCRRVAGAVGVACVGLLCVGIVPGIFYAILVSAHASAALNGATTRA